MKIWRIVTDIAVADDVTEATLEQYGKDAATNMLWTHRHHNGSSATVFVKPRGVMLLGDVPAAAAPTAQ